MTSRILLLSADFGSGHLAAARAVAVLCREIDPQCMAEPVQVQSPLLNLFTRGYLAVIGWSPPLYRRIYNMKVGWGLRTLARFVLGKLVRREIARLKPDVIVGAHPFPGGIAAELRHAGRLDAPVVMALTDFLPHGFWIHDGVDCYCVASELARESLIRMKIDPARIVVTGIAIRPEFGVSGRLFTRRSKADPIRRVLVMGGGLGLGPIVEAVLSLSALPHPELKVTVICGTNRRLERDLRHHFAADPRMEVVGFTDQVAAYMAESDLLITKPGGITCSEAMATGLPMLLLNPLPGHEEENADYLAGTGAALITDAHQVGYRAAALLFGPPAVLEQMRSRAHLASRPHAAAAIATEVLGRSKANSRLTATGA